MRLAFFSPLPPSPSGVARFSADLLPRLMARAEVEVFVEDKRSRLFAPGWPVYPFCDFPARAARRSFDRCIYQLGNNRLHLFAYHAALEHPGIAVLHDALLQHLLLGISWDAWEEEFSYAYGERGREIARNLRGGTPASHEGFFRYPLIKRVAERSRAVIVHNDEAARRVLQEAPAASVRSVPLPFFPAGREAPGRDARRELGIAANAFLVGFFGYVREARRLPVVMRAFRALRRRIARAELLLVGEIPALCSPEPGVHRTGYVSDQAFDQYASACDVVVNLRHPSAGETSAVAVRLMGLGVPVVLSDIPENAEYPADACLRVPHGEIEEELLIEYLTALAASPALGRAIGENARHHIRAEHDPERYVEALINP